jgi:sigma-B regulation protein RsbU (phosphoserine phosphatase)
VEDDADDALILREQLAEGPARFEIVSVQRLADALGCLRTEPFDVILSDLSLPDSSGPDTVERLHEAANGLPVIVLSGATDEALALAMVEHGAQDYLVKGRADSALVVRTIRYAIKRAEAERALSAERTLLRNVVDNIRDAIYVKDPECHYLISNLAHAHQLGLASPREIIGKNTRELFCPETAERFLADDRRVIDDGEAIINRHERVVEMDGRVRWLSTTKVPLHNEGGETIGLVGIGRDITARKQAEEKLAQYTRELQERNAEMRDDLEMAREVQLAFLPQQFPSFPRDVPSEQSALRFYSRYLPATALGGDFFHVAPISETAAGILICDVMGHGVRAALGTAMNRALLEELSAYAGEPGEFLTQMNRALVSILRRTRSPLFASAFYLTIDAATGRLRYANGGHPRPLLVQRAAGAVSLLENPGQRAGPALGVFGDSQYAVRETTVAAGDLLVLYTDGLYEVENAAGQLYDQPLLHQVIQARAQLPTDELFDQTVAEVRAFSATQSFADDVCLVGIEVDHFVQPPPRSA